MSGAAFEPDSNAEPIATVIVLASDLSISRKSIGSIEESIAVAGAPCEIIVMFQGLESSEVDAFSAGAPGVRFARTRLSLGAGPAYNLAARRARGKYLVFVRDGSLFQENSLKYLLATADADSNVGIVASSIFDRDGVLREAGIAVGLDGADSFEIIPRLAATRGFSDVCEVDCSSADGLLVRADRFEAVGGFDDRFRSHGFEGLDLCLAIRQTLQLGVVCDSRSMVVRAKAEKGVIDADVESFAYEKLKREFYDKWKGVIGARQRSRAPVEPPGVADELVRRGLEREIQRAKTAEAMLDATDEHAAKLELRVLEQERIILSLQSNVDALRLDLSAARNR